MTKEEAKDYIREWCPYDRQEEIIKALEQEPCCDCISRDMALEKMADYVASGYADSAEDFEEYSRIICQLPPVTPQPKMGKWIKYGRPRCGEQHYQCTSCGYYINFGQWGELYTKEFKYCPNCGATMKGEADGK